MFSKGRWVRNNDVKKTRKVVSLHPVKKRTKVEEEEKEEHEEKSQEEEQRGKIEVL